MKTYKMNIPIISELQNSYIHTFPKNLKTFLGTKALAYTQSAFAKCLINVYFWRVTSDISLLVLFNVLYALAHAVIYVPAAKYAKETNPMLPMRAAVAAQLVYLGTIMVVGNKIAIWIVPIAIIGGVADGAYWLSDNMLKFDLTTPDNRIQFTAAFQAMKNLVGMAIPPVAAIIVAASAGTTGYTYLFIAAIACSIGVLEATFFLSKQVAHGGTFCYSHMRVLFSDPTIQRVWLSTYLGEVPAVVPVMISIFMFRQTGGELAIGGYQLSTCMAVIIGNYYTGKYVTRENCRWIMTIGGIINFACIAILIVNQQFTGLLMFGIATSLISCVTSIESAIGYNALTFHCATAKECQEKRLEYLAFKEIFDAAGKITGFLLLLLVGSTLNIKLMWLVVLICSVAELLSNLVIAHVGRMRTRLAIAKGVNAALQ